jgi:hypothetical protein
MDYIYKNKETGYYLISQKWGNVKNEEIDGPDILLAIKFNKMLFFHDSVYSNHVRISYSQELKNIRKNKLKNLNQL